MSPAEQRAIARLQLESQGVDLSQLAFDRLDRIQENEDRINAATKRSTIGEAFLPAIGATVGALGVGAAPFTGGASLGLTALGAALGGAGGELLRQKTTGESDDGFDIGDVLQEGGLSGGFSLAGGGLASALGKTGRVGASTAKASSKLATAGGRSASKGIKGKLSDAGIRRFFNLNKSNVRPITDAGKNPLEIGRNVLSKAGIGIDDYDDAIGVVDEFGRGGKIGARLADTGDDLTRVVKGRSVTLKDFYDDMANKAKNLRRVPGNDRAAQRLDDLVAETKSVYGSGKVSGKKALEIKRAIDERFGKAVTQVDDLSATVADFQKEFGNHLRKGLKSSAKVADLLDEQQDLILARELLNDARASLSIAGQRGILQSLSPQGALSAIARQPVVSRSLGRLGAEGAETGGRVGLANLLSTPAGSQLAAQLVPRAAADIVGSRQARTPEELLSSIDAQIEADLGEFGVAGAAPQAPAAPSLLDPQTIGALIQQDFLQTGGENFGQLTKLLDVSETLQKLQPQEQQLSSKQQEQLTKIGGIETQFDELLKAFDAAGGGEGLKGAFERNILAKIPGLASEERVYEGLRSSLIAPLARAISGEVGVLTDRDIKRAEGLLPKLSDTSSEARQRIENLRSLIAAQKQNVVANPGAELSEEQSLVNALASIGGI